MNESAPKTTLTMISMVLILWDAGGVEVAAGAPDGIPVAVTVGTVLVCEGKRELATADNDCWAALVIDRHKVSSLSVSVPF